MHDIRYENVCIRNVTNPIVLTPHYTNFSGELLPQYRDITLRNVHILTPGEYIFAGLDAQHELGVTLDNVFAEGLSESHVLAEHANVTLGTAVGNLVPQGPGVTVSARRAVIRARRWPAATRFVAFPALQTAPRLPAEIPPGDKTLYVAADGTGDYYSIQRAIDVAPSGGAVISVAPGTYHEVLTIKKPNIVLRSPYQDASRTVVVADRSAGTAGGTLQSATVNVLADRLPCREHLLRERLQSHSSAAAAGLAGRRPAGAWRSRHLRERARTGQPGHAVRGRPECTGTARRLSCRAPVFRSLLHRGQRRFHLWRRQERLRSLRHPQHAALHRLHHGAEQELAGQDSGSSFTTAGSRPRPDVANVYLGRPWRPYASSGLRQHVDGCPHRSRGLARVASGGDPLSPYGVLRRVSVERARRGSRRNGSRTRCS